MINFSFIIPHKNIPDLLQKALDSIPRRNDVEIIVVDDNSDPGTTDFSHFPGINDPSVQVVFTKEGKGAGYARNIGLEKASGKWILFCDADDFYTDKISFFLDEYNDSDADIVLWKTCSIDFDTGHPSHRGETLNEFVDEGIATGNFSNALLISCPVKGMYSSAFLVRHNIRFNESHWGNDVVFSTKVADSAKKIIASNFVSYCITSHRNFGLMSNPSLSSILVRFSENAKSVRIARKKFNGNPNIHKWFFDTWFAVYKRNKFQAIKLIPTAIYSDKLHFIKEVSRAL